MRMWAHRHLYACTGLLGFLIAPSVQQEGQAGVHWLFPKPDEHLTYHHNDVINVTWVSTFPTPVLITFCGGANVNQVGVENVLGYNASALIKLDFTHDDATCWFDLKPDLDGGQGSNSEGFAYVSEEGDAATIGLLSSSTAVPSPTTTSSGTTSTSADTTSNAKTTGTRTNLLTTGTASATTSSAAEATETASAGLSTGAQAGIGVGVGLAGIAVGAWAVIMFLRRRRRGQVTDEKFHAADGPPTTPGDSSAAAPPYSQPSEYGGGSTAYGTSPTMAPVAADDHSKYILPHSFPQPRSQRHELSSVSAPHELDAPVYPAVELPASR